MTLRARFLWTGDGPVIEGGAVTISGGRITGVGNRGATCSGAEEDFGEAVILPGLVNAHTHLELTHLAGRVRPAPDFIDWLRRIYRVNIASPVDDDSIRKSVADGIARSLGAGVTALGDITRHPTVTRPVLAEHSLAGVSFGEITAVGKRRGLLPERLAAASIPGVARSEVVAGISPHAPYTVEPDAMRACADIARRDRLPVCVHVAETPFEEEFTRNAAGPFADYLRELHLWDEKIPASGCSPVELVERCGLLGRRTILAHANYVSDEDIARIAASSASVAYCPRTHAAFEHEPHRFREMMAAGITVAVGTDSLASNPTLSVLEELRFLHQHHPDVITETLLSMGTRMGSAALGLDGKTGFLSPGMRADLVVLPLAQGACAWTSILDVGAGEPLAIFLRGQRISRDERTPG